MTKKLLALALAVAMVLTMAACGSKASKGLEYTPNTSGGGYYVSGIGTCTDTDVVIPETYEGVSVTSIGKYAFRGNTSMTGITIGNGVTSIGDYAFMGCSALTGVVLSESLTSIGAHAFSLCAGLTSVTIPNSVITVGDYAFTNCAGLTSITIGSGVALIGINAFSGCTNLTDIYFQGTQSKWASIGFGGGWNENTGDYTVHCTDGDISK